MTDEQQKGINDTPVQDISDSKDEAEKSFLKELDDAEKSQPAVASPPTPNKGAGDDKSKSKFSSLVDSLSSKKSRKRDIDPILGVSLAVFILCSVVVLGNFVYGEITHDSNSTVVKSGDTVYVQYVGSYNEYFVMDTEKTERGRAVVFDNNYEYIGKYLNDDSNISQHSWSFDKKTSYSDLSFVVGSSTVLTKFGNATIGHKVGDTVDVHISAADAYELTSDNKGLFPATTDVITIPMNMTIDSTSFNSLTGVTAPVAGEHKVITDAKNCPFGWSYTASLDSTGKNVIINNNGIVAGQTTYNPFGQTNYKISDVTISADGKSITFKYGAFQNTDKFIKVPVLHKNVWTAAYLFQEKNDAGNLVTKYKTDEKAGVDLYFHIKITKITSS